MRRSGMRRGNDGKPAAVEGVHGVAPDKGGVPLVAWVDRDGDVAEHRLEPGRCDRDRFI